jgi:hypothetical protein
MKRCTGTWRRDEVRGVYRCDGCGAEVRAASLLGRTLASVERYLNAQHR